MAINKYTYVDFRRNQPVVATSAVGQIGVVTDAAVNFFNAGGIVFECRNEQQNDDIIPTMVLDANGDGGTNEGASGWQVPLDKADNDGIEIGLGILADRARPGCFKVGTDPAFFMAVKMSVPDVSEHDVCFAGFRIAAAYLDAVNTAAALGTVPTDIAGINVDAGDFKTVTRLNTGTATTTDVTVTNWADDEAHELRVNVSAAGAVTYAVDGTAPSDAVAFSFDTGDLVIPCIIITRGAAVADTPPILQYFACGYQ